MLHAAALAVDIRIPDCHSLKEKRATVKHLVATCRSRFDVSASEVGFQEQWQRSELGFAVVSGSQSQVVSVLDSVERFVWSHPGLEVVATERTWLETDG
jgi:hypothetical protein